MKLKRYRTIFIFFNKRMYRLFSLPFFLLLLFVFLFVNENAFAANSSKKKSLSNKPLSQEDIRQKEIELTYPQNFSLQIPNPTYQGKVEKKYLANVVQSLLYDFLSVQTKVWLANVAPFSVTYRKKKSLAEDSYDYNKFLKSGLFPLEIQKNKKIQDTQKKDFFLYLHIQEETAGFQLQVRFNRLGEELYQKKITLKENQIAEQMKEIADDLRSLLAGPKQGELQVNSKPTGASLYLNGIYFGKTPFSISHISEDLYHLTLRKENYRPFVQDIPVGVQENKFSFSLTKDEGKGSIALTTKPAGAKIYLDREYIGVTPMLIKNLTMGFHRLGIQKENYNVYQNDIEISEKKFAYKFNLTLKPIRPNAFNYQQLIKRNLNASKAMFVFSAIFMISGVAMLVERDNYLQKEFRSVYTVGTQAWQENQNKIELFENLAIGFLVGSGLSLITGGVLYVRYLNILSKSLLARPKTFGNLMAYADKNQSGFSFSVTTHY